MMDKDDKCIPCSEVLLSFLESTLHFLRPVRLNHPYLIYSRTLFDTTGEPSSVMFRCYFNPTEYYPMSNPLTIR